MPARTGNFKAGRCGLLLAVLLAACQNKPKPEQLPPQPFVLRSLELRQRDPQGRLLWEISSPETRYDLSRRLAQARQLRGVIYQKGRPLYRLSASTAVVINDGELVQLEGPTRLERLDKERPAVITALRVRWYPKQERMEIDRSPQAVQGDLQLTAGLARFLLDAERLELHQQPLLVQRGDQPLRLELGSVAWWPGSGALQARGPVRGLRRLNSGAEQRLTAPALRGNTTTQIIDLQAPVTLEAPDQQASLTGGATQLNLLDRSISSESPFQARYRQARLSGGGVSLSSSTTTVTVRRGCQLQQGGDILTAESCRWNWTSDAVAAAGEVVVRRPAAGLETSAARLDGRLGKQGVAVFRAPGSRVRTRALVPAGSGPRPIAPVPRPRQLRTDPEPPFQL